MKQNNKHKRSKMNKKGGTVGILGLIILLIIGYACWDYYQETKGSNSDKADFCRDLGYEVNNEIDPLFDMNCYKIEGDIRKDYRVIESNWTWNNKDEEHSYYLREINR